MQYFTTFKVESASAPTYNESMVGQVGNPSFKSTYNGHEFHFLSNENKNIFEKVVIFLYVCMYMYVNNCMYVCMYVYFFHVNIII